MTKYANTPAGRAAAAADMAATGTTMGRRPTGPKGPMVQPGVPSGPKIGVRPADPKPANPRVTYGPRSVAPYDDTPTATRTPSGPGKTKFQLDSNGNYIIPPGTMNSVSFPRLAPPQQVGLSAPQQPVGGPRGQLPGTVGSAIGTPYNKPSFFKKGGAVKSKAMRGGGLARKGVGMALAKGGLARRAGGCAKRGVGKGKMV